MKLVDDTNTSKASVKDAMGRRFFICTTKDNGFYRNLDLHSSGLGLHYFSLGPNLLTAFNFKYRLPKGKIGNPTCVNPPPRERIHDNKTLPVASIDTSTLPRSIRAKHFPYHHILIAIVDYNHMKFLSARFYSYQYMPFCTGKLRKELFVNFGTLL